MTLLCCLGCQEDKVEPDLFGSLTGTVSFQSNSLPVAGATISTSPATSNTLTAADGSFEFESIKEGTYAIRAELDGYLAAVESITIEEGQTSSVILVLVPGTPNNTAPEPASSPIPTSGESAVPLDLELSWLASDADEDELTYDIYLFEAGQSSGNNLIASGLSDPNYSLSDLRYGTTYFWQVAVNDGTADPVFGEVWEFTTLPFPNHSFTYAKINNGVYEIYSGGIANEFYQLTENGSNYRPRFSPQGNRIAYINANFPEKRLFVMNRDGTNPEIIPTNLAIEGANDLELDYSWSPDGTQLLYMRSNRLYKINIDGTGLALFAELPNDEFVEVDWSGPTNRIAVRTVGNLPYQSKILLYDEDGGLLEELVPDVPGSIGGPTFSIDGNAILYTRDTTGFESPDGRQLESHIFIKDLTTGITTDLSVNKPLGFNDLDPRFSPNGAFIVFTQADNFPNAQKDIYIMNLDGEGRVKLFDNAEMPDWWN